MTAGDVLPPEAVEATDAAGAALIDAVVARRRAELARLSLAARTARQRCDRAEKELASVAEVGADGVPADLLGVVDAMLEKALAASELALDTAEREATFIIDRAVADGATALRRAGLDPATVSAVRTPGTAPRSVVAPPTAAELWRATQRTSPRTSTPRPATAATGPAAPSASDHVVVPSPPSSVAAPRTHPGPSASAPFVPVVVPDHGIVDAASVPSPAPQASGTLLLDEPVAPAGAADPVDSFDTFWQEVPGERRVRDRLLRRSPKESA